jgi:uncharacterized protein (UPF0332 family)
MYKRRGCGYEGGIMNDIGVKELIEKAHQSLEAAKLLFDEGFIDFSASRAYYSMFYTIEALLLSQNLSFSKHSAVISAFGKNFIKSGIFDARFHRYIMDAFDLRNKGDYGAMHSVPEEKADQLISDAADLFDAVKSWLFPEPSPAFP